MNQQPFTPDIEQLKKFLSNLQGGDLFLNALHEGGELNFISQIS